jgi:2-oxoisovalerate dehydrogenase E1 component
MNDPFPKLKKLLSENEISDEELEKIETDAAELVGTDFIKALDSPEPDINKATDYVFVPTTVTEEKGERTPAGKEKVIMVDAALFAIRELMEDHPECIFFRTRCWPQAWWCFS